MSLIGKKVTFNEFNEGNNIELTGTVLDKFLGVLEDAAFFREGKATVIDFYLIEMDDKSLVHIPCIRIKKIVKKKHKGIKQIR